MGDAPKITRDDIEQGIANEEYAVFGGRLTVAVVTMANGFLVVGQSSCVHPDNFDAALGKHFAREDAIKQMWPLMGYALRAMICERSQMTDTRPDTPNGMTR